MDAKTSVEDALKKAVIRAERMAGEKQIRQMVDLTIDLVLAILKNIVVGEEPVQLVSPSGLTMTIAMYPKGSISNKVIKHGESTYVFPHVCDILIHQECYGNETLGVSYSFNIYQKKSIHLLYFPGVGRLLAIHSAVFWQQCRLVV